MTSISKWTSRLFVPVALLAIASLVAILASQPSPVTSATVAEAETVGQMASAATTGSASHMHADQSGGMSGDDAAHLAMDASDPTHQHAVSVAGVTSSDGHTHDSTAPGTPASGPIVSVDDPRLTPAQQDAARSLLVASRASIAAHPNATALAAAGYVPVGDNSSGMQHWVNDAFTHDGRELDPSRVESFMTEKASGRTTGAMYILEPGRTMANVPDIAGELTTWHVHQLICFSTAQIWHFVSFASNGNCPAGSAARAVPPMMHVWADDPPCGPFVGSDGHGSTNCSAHGH